MVQVVNVFAAAEAVEGVRPRRLIKLAQEPDLRIGLNIYQPGANNEFHYHQGTSQSFLVLRGELTVRTNRDGEVTEHKLTPGQCVLIPEKEYYQIANTSTEPVMIYPVKHQDEKIVVLGKGALEKGAYFTPERQAKEAL